MLANVNWCLIIFRLKIHIVNICCNRFLIFTFNVTILSLFIIFCNHYYRLLFIN